MIFKTDQKQPGFSEFVTLMAFIISLVALSIDTMLPALPEIAGDLKLGNLNESHFIISMLFLGMAFGQMLFGPLSDVIGRKPAIIGGIVIFAIGSLISYFAGSMEEMLIGRFLQGIGASGPRIVSVALVRDRYEGRQMARVMSFVMTIFILVPIFAPAIGQLIMNISHWRFIFAMFLVMSLLILLWFGIRQPETLVPDKRIKFSTRRLINDTRKIIMMPVATGYTLTMGFLYGAFVGYLSSAQQILQGQYGLGQLFVVYFGVLAVSIGVAALVNATLVLRFGMRRLSFISMIVILLLSILFYGVFAFYAGHPPLAMLMVYLILLFFFLGVLFGNLNALAMEPLGRIAGLGSALVGSISTLMSVILGALIADANDGTVMPLMGGFAVLSFCCLICMYLTENLANRAPST